MTRVTLVESRGGRCRLRAVGEFDRDNCDQFGAATRVALSAYCAELVVDLAEATFVDAATTRALLECYEHAATYGCQLRIVNTSGVVARVLELCDARRALLSPAGR